MNISLMTYPKWSNQTCYGLFVETAKAKLGDYKALKEQFAAGFPDGDPDRVKLYDLKADDTALGVPFVCDADALGAALTVFRFESHSDTQIGLAKAKLRLEQGAARLRGLGIDMVHWAAPTPFRTERKPEWIFSTAEVAAERARICSEIPEEFLNIILFEPNLDQNKAIVRHQMTVIKALTKKGCKIYSNWPKVLGALADSDPKLTVPIAWLMQNTLGDYIVVPRDGRPPNKDPFKASLTLAEAIRLNDQLREENDSKMYVLSMDGVSCMSSFRL